MDLSVDPKKLFTMGGRLRLFRQQHPLFSGFLHQVEEQALEPGTVIEIKAVRPDGKEIVTNLKLTEDDVETIRIASSLDPHRNK